MKMNAWIVVDKDNRPLGVDTNSGGYHYVPSDLNGIRYWSTQEEAQGYVDVFNSSSHQDKPVAVKYVRLLMYK